MNMLVGYGSSSEDEDAIETSTLTASNIPASYAHAETSTLTNGAGTKTNGSEITTVADSALEPIQGPVVGPTRPDESTSTEPYEDEGAQDQPPMSERDLLRYLTQPTHPMVLFPPEPADTADPAVTAKFRRFLELKAQGIHFNEDLAGKSSFKNPNLFASLLERSGLPSQSQYASALPANTFTLEMFPEWAYKDNLLRAQQALGAEADAKKKTQSATGNRRIDFTSASRETTPGSIAKRKRT